MSKKLIASSLMFLLSMIVAVLIISLDRIDKSSIGGGYENGLQVDTFVKVK